MLWFGLYPRFLLPDVGAACGEACIAMGVETAETVDGSCPHPPLRCSASPPAEFNKICSKTAIGFVVMGFIGFFVKLIFIVSPTTPWGAAAVASVVALPCPDGSVPNAVFTPTHEFQKRCAVLHTSPRPASSQHSRPQSARMSKLQVLLHKL